MKKKENEKKKEKKKKKEKMKRLYKEVFFVDPPNHRHVQEFHS
jgi:hypothetical protein